jgi:hypothetical protein
MAKKLAPEELQHPSREDAAIAQMTDVITTAPPPAFDTSRATPLVAPPRVVPPAVVGAKVSYGAVDDAGMLVDAQARLSAAAVQCGKPIPMLGPTEVQHDVRREPTIIAASMREDAVSARQRFLRDRLCGDDADIANRVAALEMQPTPLDLAGQALPAPSDEDTVVLFYESTPLAPPTSQPHTMVSGAVRFTEAELQYNELPLTLLQASVSMPATNNTSKVAPSTNQGD